MNKDDGPATTSGQKMEPQFPGSLRDWFAGMALQGFITSRPDDVTTLEVYAAWAYQAADAMLAAREVCNVEYSATE